MIKGKRIQLIKRISIHDPLLLRKFKLKPFPIKPKWHPDQGFESHAGYTVFGRNSYPRAVIPFRLKYRLGPADSSQYHFFLKIKICSMLNFSLRENNTNGDKPENSIQNLVPDKNLSKPP